MPDPSSTCDRTRKTKSTTQRKKSFLPITHLSRSTRRSRKGNGQVGHALGRRRLYPAHSSDFDGAKGCAVLVYAGAGPTGAAALNVPSGDITSYEMLHGNWIKSADCKFAEVPGLGDRKTVECICQKTN